MQQIQTNGIFNQAPNGQITALFMCDDIDELEKAKTEREKRLKDANVKVLIRPIKITIE